jgi:hypothetical protein
MMSDRQLTFIITLKECEGIGELEARRIINELNDEINAAINKVIGGNL